MHLYGKYYPDSCHIKFINNMYVSNLYNEFKYVLNRVEQFQCAGGLHLVADHKEIEDFFKAQVSQSKIGYMSVYRKGGFNWKKPDVSIRKIMDLSMNEFADLYWSINKIYNVIKDQGAADRILGNTIDIYQWSGV